AVQAVRTAATPLTKVVPEGEVLLSQLDWQLLDELESLAPFGEGNPRPLLCCRHAYLKEARQVGKNGGHLKLRLAAEGQEIGGIGFNLRLPPQLRPGAAADLVFYLERNVYQEKEELQLQVQYLRPARRTGNETSACRQWVAATAEDVPVFTWSRQLLACFNSDTPPEEILFSSGTAVSQCYLALRRVFNPGNLYPLGPWLGRAEAARLKGQANGCIIACSPFYVPAKGKQRLLVSPFVTAEQVQGTRLQPVLGNWQKFSDLFSTLKNLLAGCQRVLIYETDFYKIKELAAWLQQQFPDLRLTVDTYTVPRQTLLAQQEANRGRLPLLLARRGRPAWFYPADAVIFNYLPDSREEVELALPLVGQLPAVYFRIETGDRPVIDLRQELVQFYRQLQHRADNDRGLYIFNNKGYHQRCYLAILEELELARVERRSRGLAVSLLPANEKRDLLASRRFQQLCAETKLAHRFKLEITGAGGDDCGPEGTGTTEKTDPGIPAGNQLSVTGRGV
ncbi:MAG: hypothetical protein GX039_02585, partial [Clostridia bacterium]|nr:hypothetical protein [Clostridia bacterium]